MKLLLTFLFALATLLSASAQPHQRQAPTPAVFATEKPMHTTALMAGAAWSLSRDAALQATLRARTRPTQPVPQPEL
jgi:hypothetical protein